MPSPESRHLDDYTLEQYVLGGLNVDRNSAISEHLEVCPTCREQAAEFEHESARIKIVLSVAHSNRSTDCPSQEVLALFLDRGLRSDERATIENHLTQCPECRTSLQALRHELAVVLASADETMEIPGGPSTLFYSDFMNEPKPHSPLTRLIGRTGPVVTGIAFMTCAGYFAPAVFRLPILFTSTIAVVVAVHFQLYRQAYRRATFRKRFICSLPVVPFAAAWLFPSQSYWCLSLALIGVAIVTSKAQTAASSDRSDATAESNQPEEKSERVHKR